jgi:integrase
VNVLSQLVARKLEAGKYADGQGLWLVKRERSAGKWVLRLTRDGTRREMGLGRWPDVSIAEAREKAAEARRLDRAAICPIEARRKARRVVRRLTVAEAIEGCFEARKAELKGDGEAGRWMSPLAVHVIPKIGKRPVEEIDQHALKELLEPIWHSKPEAAKKALNRFNLTLKHCIALGLNVDLQATMKARVLLGKQRRTSEHIPALHYTDAREFYRWLSSKDVVAAWALRLLMLTVARPGEVRLAPLVEFEGHIWNIPAERTKTNIARRVPLVVEAQKVVGLCRAASSNGLAFPAYKGQPISDMAMTKLLDRSGYEARPHGFRATFRTWCEEQTDADNETKESCLGHIVDSETVSAYQRSDRFMKRWALLAKWEAHLLG